MASIDFGLRYGVSLVHFDPKAEARLRLKIDLYIIPTVFMLYLFCFIDRANIGNARLAGLEKELGLKGYDYNKVLSVFYVSYIIFEIPSNMACKWLGPGWYIPTISLCFGICSIGTAFCNTLSTVSGVRFLLGIFEAGMLPGIACKYPVIPLALTIEVYCSTAPEIFLIQVWVALHDCLGSRDVVTIPSLCNYRMTIRLTFISSRLPVPLVPTFRIGVPSVALHRRSSSCRSFRRSACFGHPEA